MEASKFYQHEITTPQTFEDVLAFLQRFGVHADEDDQPCALRVGDCVSRVAQALSAAASLLDEVSDELADINPASPLCSWAPRAQALAAHIEALVEHIEIRVARQAVMSDQMKPTLGHALAEGQTVCHRVAAQRLLDLTVPFIDAVKMLAEYLSHQDWHTENLAPLTKGQCALEYILATSSVISGEAAEMVFPVVHRLSAGVSISLVRTTALLQ